MSRIFTTIQEVDDKLILYGFIAGFFLNAVMAGQMVCMRQPVDSSVNIATGVLLEESRNSIPCSRIWQATGEDSYRLHY